MTENIYKTIFNITNDTILIHSNGIAIEINKAFTKLLGYNLDEIKNKNLIDLIVVKNYHKLIFDKIENNIFDSFEVELISKDKKIFFVEVEENELIIDNQNYRLTIFRNISERKKWQFEIKENNDQISASFEILKELTLKFNDNEKRLKRAKKIAKLGFWELDLEKNSLYWSDEVYRMFDLEPQEFDATYEAFLDNIHPEDHNMVNKAYSEHIAERKEYNIIHRLLLKSGEIKYVNERCETEFDEEGKPLKSLGTILDITDRIFIENKLLTTNRILKILSETNHLLIKSTNEFELLNQICKIIVIEGGYKLAWIGYAENDENKTVKTIAQFGYDNEYLKPLKITWADNEFGNGPTGTAIRTQKTCIARDILNDSNFEPWRDAAIKQGFASSISLPLIYNLNVFGAISIYSTEKNVFDNTEIKLLTELAEDIAFGISNIRTKNKQAEFEQTILENEAQLNTLIDTIPDLVWLKDENGKYLHCNKSFELVFGVPRNEIIGKTDYDFVNKNLADFYRENDKIAINLGKSSKNDEEVVFAFDGHTETLETIKTPILKSNGELIGVLGIARNISDRKKTEQKMHNLIIETEEKERKRFAQDIHDGFGPILSSLRHYFDWLLKNEDAKAKDIIKNQINELFNEAISNIKDITYNLSPVFVETLGIIEALERFINKTTQINKINIKIISNLKNKLKPEIELTLYRIFTELINNTIKYAKASYINIVIQKSNKSVKCIYTDNGIGFDLKTKTIGTGLFNIENRINTLGGNFHIVTEKNKGLKFYFNLFF